MSKVKKVLAIILSMAMILGMSLTTFAAPQPVTDITSKITVEGLSSGVNTEVRGYQFASLQYDAENNEYSWLIADWAKDYVTLNEDGTAYEIDSANEAALKDAAAGLQTTAFENLAVEGTSCEFTVPIGGYVIIPSDNNADYEPLFVTNTYDRTATPGKDGKPVAVDVTAYAKSEGHTVDKTQEDDFAQIGQEVDYTINATFPMAQNAEGESLTKFIITDTPTGLDIKVDTVAVTISGVSVTNEVTVNKAAGTGVLTVDFANVLAKHKGGEPVVITYTAIVTDTEYNNSVGGDSNTTDYDDGNTSGDNGSITITKVDAEDTDKTLKGAEFKVYDLGVDGIWDAQNKGTAMELIYDEDLDAYRPVLDGEEAAETVAVNSNGVLKVVGLDEGKYHFEEVVAPDGYSINTDGLTVTITEGEAATEHVSENFLDTKLASLPETGGMGTTIFTIGGCVIMIAAAGLYFASRRKENK